MITDERPLGAFEPPFRTIAWPFLPSPDRAGRRADDCVSRDGHLQALRAAVAFTLFAGGCDTIDVARVLRIGEAEAVRLVRLGREAAE